MIGRSRSTVRHEERTAAWLRKPRGFRLGYVLGRHAYLTVRAVERLIASSRESEREILRVPLADGGSFLIRRGDVDFRSWWLTVSFASGCLVLTLEPSDSGCSDTTSASGTGTGRTSGSSRSSNEEAVITGTEDHTHADE